MIRSIILLVIGGTLLFLALRSLRAHRIKERYALLFFCMGLPFLGLAIWPDAVVFMVDTLQIEKPTVLVLCLTVFCVVMIFKLLSIISVQDRKIATLAQMVSMLMEKQSLVDDRGATRHADASSPTSPPPQA